MDNAPQNKPNNTRSITTGKLELRKLWSVPKAEFIYALFVELRTETAKLRKGTPDWSHITSSELSWQTPQGYVGDEEWARKTAEHFEISFPEEEYKADDTEDKSEQEA